MQLTNRQNSTMIAISKLTQQQGYAPTLRQLAGYLGISETRVRQLVDRLVALRRVARDCRVARSIRVVGCGSE